MVPAIIQQGFFVEFLVGGKGEYRHYFCGPNQIRGAHCPNCAKPLLQFLILDTHDPRLNLTRVPSPTISLLYCWTCNIAGEGFFYQLIADGVKLLKYGRGGLDNFFNKDNFPRHFPGAPARLIPLTTEEQRAICSLNADEIDYPERDELAQALAVPMHQVGGEPYLVQHDWECTSLTCPVCHREMSFLASIGDDAVLPRGFVENDFVQVLYSYCSLCHVVGAIHTCD